MKSSAADARMPGSDLRLCRRDPGFGFVGIGSIAGRFMVGGVADRIGRRSVLAGAFGGLALMQAWLLFATTARQISISAFVFGSCYGGIVALFPAINVDYFGGRNASGIIGVMYTSPPPTPACRPALSARTFSGRTISGIARAACGLASAARRTERHVNADSHMRISSRLDPARRAMSTHHARASSARMPRRRDGRLPCSKRAVSILQLWCNLNPCTSIRGLH